MIRRITMFILRFFLSIKNYIDILFSLKIRNKEIQQESYNLNGYQDGYNFLHSSSNELLEFANYLHRTILWDDSEPLACLPHIKSVKKHTPNRIHIMWNNNSSKLLLLDNFLEYKTIYYSFERKILKADFLRYLIVYKYGGAYLDLDIKMYYKMEQFLNKIEEENSINMETDNFCILFTEHIVGYYDEIVNEKTQPIRASLQTKYMEESKIRVANYAFIASPKHPFIKKVLDECVKRSVIKPGCDYDVLFITGPDVLSFVYQTLSDDYKVDKNIILIDKKDSDLFIFHECSGVWRS